MKNKEMINTKVRVDITHDERAEFNWEEHTDGFKGTSSVLFLNKSSVYYSLHCTCKFSILCYRDTFHNKTTI